LTKSPCLALLAMAGSSAGIHNHLGLLERRELMKVAQELEESHIPRQIRFADASKHPQIRLEQGEQALRAILVHVTTRILFLRMIDELVDVALHGPIAAGRIGIQATACVHREIGRFLHRLDGKVSRRLYDDATLAADPGDNRGPIFVIMPPTGLTLLATTPWSPSQRFLPALLGLALLASRVIEVIGFDRACQLATHLVRQGGIAQPPAPAIAGPNVDAQLSGNAPGETGKAQQKGGENPVRHGPLALVQQGRGEVVDVEGALAALAPVAFAPRPVVVCTPGINVLALTPGTLKPTIFPPEGVNVRLALFGTEELVDIREHRHGGASPGGLRSLGNGEEILTYFARFALLQTARN
jgi:hypothetical protein